MSDAEIPEVGASVTFDFDGNLRGAEAHVEVPGAASGSDPLQYEWEPGSGDDPAPAGPGWMPDTAPPFDPTDIMHAPTPEGWHRDNLGLLHPDLSATEGSDTVLPTDLHMRDEPELGDHPEHQGEEYGV